MKLNVNISLPNVWGQKAFKKEEWGPLNLLVGPNGTGKTLFAEKLEKQCTQAGLNPRYLSAERLSGLERKRYGLFGRSQLQQGFNIGDFQRYQQQAANYGLSSDAFVILNEKLDVKLRVEGVLSDLFGRRIRLAKEGGYLKPKLQKTGQGNEYELKEDECHGLKELITLLTFLYEEEHNCLIIDEPELHLHPQYQTFFLREVRRWAGNPREDSGKKCFFLITHSPYFVDFRSAEDLGHCVIFRPSACPKYVSDLDESDAELIGRLLPRLNTHHKQFFFASRPIFVEGYTDQQIFTLIQERRNKSIGASGSSIIDVGGKAELDFFFRLCKKLGVEGQFIADLDAVFSGKLRRSVGKDERSKAHVRKAGLEEDTTKLFGKAEQAIGECLQAIDEELSGTENPELAELFESLKNAEGLSEKRYILFLGLQQFGNKIREIISGCCESLDLIESRVRETIEAFRKSNVYLLPDGELENHLPSYDGSPYQIVGNRKLKAFTEEREFLTQPNLSEEEVTSRYPKLVGLLDRVSNPVSSNAENHLEYEIGEWIHKVQMAFRRDEIDGIESLKSNASVQWEKYGRVFDLLDFSATHSAFSCQIKLKPLVDSNERVIRFDESVTASSFSLDNVS